MIQVTESKKLHNKANIPDLNSNDVRLSDLHKNAKDYISGKDYIRGSLSCFLNLLRKFVHLYIFKHKEFKIITF